MDYNFHSTDPDNFNEVNCPVIYTGCCTKVKWFISDITTNHNIVVLGKEDYITIAPEELDTVTIHLEEDYNSADSSFINELQNLLQQNINDSINVSKDSLNRVIMTSSYYFEIVDMSYNMKQALGFYYLGDKYTITPTQDKTTLIYYIKSKASSFESLTPVWYLISNLGCPNQINANNNPWTPLFPAVVMSIQNSFQSGQPLTYSNSSYVSVSPASALSNLRVKLVDGNLQPIKLTAPLYVSVSISEVTKEDKAETEEQLADQGENPDTKRLIRDTRERYITRKSENGNKVEAGPTVEPQTAPLPKVEEFISNEASPKINPNKITPQLVQE